MFGVQLKKALFRLPKNVPAFHSYSKSSSPSASEGNAGKDEKMDLTCISPPSLQLCTTLYSLQYF